MHPAINKCVVRSYNGRLPPFAEKRVLNASVLAGTGSVCRRHGKKTGQLERLELSAPSLPNG